MIFGHVSILKSFTSQMLLLKMVYRPRYDFWPHADSEELYRPNATFENGLQLQRQAKI